MKGYLIVIPYLPIAAQGKELRYAVAGWRKHFKEDYHIVIVGDGVKHLSKDPFFARPDVTVLTSRRVEGTPGNYRQHLDYVSCLKKVHEAFPDTDGFIMVADDCYAVRDFHFRDIVWPMCNAQDFCGDDKSDGWARDMWKTKQLLVREGLPHVNYTTHLPQWYSWTRLEQIWKRYDMEHNSYVIENIYYNVYQSPIPPELLNNETDTIRLGVWRAGLTMSEFRAKSENKIWVVNSVEGFSLTLQDFLEEHMKEELR